MTAHNLPSPSRGEGPGMGVSAGRLAVGAIRLCASLRFSPKLSGHTPTQPSPLEGEGFGGALV